jgi:hypothetical protein
MGKDTVSDNELGGMLGRGRELAIERREVAVRIAVDVGKTEACGVDERRMIEAVEEKMITAAGERRDCAETRLIARGEDERRFLLEQSREAFLELVVKIERAVEKATAGGTTSVAPHCIHAGGEYARMVRQAEVVVRADHDLPMAVDSRLGGCRFLDRLKIRIDAPRLYLLGERIAVRLVENIHQRIGRS